MTDLQIIETSSKKIGVVYARLEKLGRGDLRKQLRKELAASSKPARMKVRDMEKDYLPSGMDKKYTKIPTQTLNVSKTGVSMVWKQRRTNSDLKALDRGRLRHPLFGNRKFWYEQSIPAGMWSKSIDKVAPGVIRDTGEALDNYVKREL